MLKSFIAHIVPQSVVRNIFKERPVVWLVHPRNIEDVARGIPFAKILPESLLKIVIGFIPPIVVGSFRSENASGNGYIIAVPLLPKDFSKGGPKVEKTISRAMNLAKKLGAKAVSVGGFLSSAVARYNNENKQNFDIPIHDGTELLSRVVVQKIEELITNANRGSDDVLTVGIIGATTKIGSLISKMSSQMNIDVLYLFGKTPENLKRLSMECERDGGPEIRISTDLKELSMCDISILTAYLHEDVIIKESAKEKSIFFSAIEPISPFVFELEKTRYDMTVIKGISIKTPGISYGRFDFGLPPEHSFACLTEAVILVDRDPSTDGVFSPDKDESVKQVGEFFKEHQFSI